MSTIKKAVVDLLNPALPAQEALDAHFAPDFRQRLNGNWIERTAFFDGIVRLRESLDKAVVTVLDELSTGEHYAARHLINLAMRDGQVINQEVYLFARRDLQGRFVCIDEVSMAVSAENARNLAKMQ